MRDTASITIRHNIEVAHRLFLTSGKCEQIHGHSMWVELEIPGVINTDGMLNGLEFGSLKKEFRTYLDTTFDHKLLLNLQDPFAGSLIIPDDLNLDSHGRVVTLPGLVTLDRDPTTENIAVLIGGWAQMMCFEAGTVRVQETAVNAASYSWK